MEQARLVQDIHRADPHAAGRLADGLTQMPEVGGYFLGFKLVGELGRGAFGRVFLAEQAALANRLVALKIAPDVGGESRTLAQLQHTHIVPIHSVHSAGPFQAVCMPFFGRTTLADILRHLATRSTLPQSAQELLTTPGSPSAAPPPGSPEPSRTVVTGSGAPPADPSGASSSASTPGPRGSRPRPAGMLPHALEGRSYVDAVLWLGRCLADGLAHAHERGILHRDLKPANILLSDDGQPMLLDFNLAEDTKVSTHPSAALIGGTLPYMAPEHLHAFRGGRATIDARSDLFSLGIILYELLTGRAPFPQRRQGVDENGARQSLAELLAEMARDREGPPPSPRRLNRAVSPAADAIIRRCLDADPERRYRNARDLHEDLQRQLERMPLKHTREPSLRERFRKWLHHHPRTLLKGFAVGAVLFLGLALWLAVRSASLARSGEALAALEGFRDDARAAHTALVSRVDDPEQQRKGVALGLRALERYGTLHDPGWVKKAPAVDLPEDDQQRLRRDVGELLLLLARAQATPAAGDRLAEEVRREGLRGALRLNQLAESSYPGEAPPALWLQRADLLRQLGEASEAQRLRERVEGLTPRTAHDHFLVAREHLAARRPRQALPLLREATRLDPQSFWSWLLLGDCCLELGEDIRAVNSYGVCIALAPQAPWPHFNRGLAHLRLRDFGPAAADFDRALALKPDLAEAYVNRALARQGLKDHAGAVEDLTRALEHGASATRVYFMRARARERAGDREGARRDHEEGLRREPTDEKSWVARGLARLGAEPERALEDFDRALALNPRSRPALQNKAHALAERLGRTEEAVRVLDTVVALYPDYTPARSSRGVLHGRLGRRDDALRDARQSLERDGRPPIRYQVAGIYALTSKAEPGDRGPALALLADALRQGYGADLLARDADLDPLRSLPDFQRLATAAAALQPPAGKRPAP
jgi:serine/threonine protein kinase/Flp pilus assembly protein TadD